MPSKLSRPPGEAERIEERRARVWALRRAGGTVYSISEQLSREGTEASPSTVANDLKVKLDEFRALEGDNAQAWRDDMIAKLDDLIKTQLEFASQKQNIRNADNANAARMAMERKAKLLGIDAPASINHTVHTVTDLINSVIFNTPQDDVQ